MTDPQAAQDDNMPPEEIVNTEQSEPVEAEAQASTEESAPSSAEDNSEKPEVEETDSFQKRINKVTADKYAEKRRADELEKKLAEMQVPEQKLENDIAPKLEDFDYDEQRFNEALIDYKVNQKAQSILTQQSEQQEREKQLSVQSTFNENVAKLTETAPDYTEVVGHLPDFPQDTLNAIMEAEDGPQLAYYLAKHLDVADKIASASSIQGAMMLGQISAQLSSAKPVTKQSAAPDPIQPVNSSGAMSKSPEDMTMEEIYNS